MSRMSGVVKPLLDYIEMRQDDDWARLSEAIRSAANGVWSIECGQILNQIRLGMGLVGPSEPGRIPWEMSRDGIYTLVTGEDVTEFVDAHRELMARHSTIPELPIGVHRAVEGEMQRPVER